MTAITPAGGVRQEIRQRINGPHDVRAHHDDVLLVLIRKMEHLAQPSRQRPDLRRFSAVNKVAVLQ